MDLYAEYVKQFSKKSIRTANAPDITFTKIYSKDEIYFYVIGFDEDAFPEGSFLINEDHELDYRVEAGNVSDATYMNIIVVVR
jgi:hypothetical protein